VCRSTVGLVPMELEVHSNCCLGGGLHTGLVPEPVEVALGEH